MQGITPALGLCAWLEATAVAQEPAPQPAPQAQEERVEELERRLEELERQYRQDLEELEFTLESLEQEVAEGRRAAAPSSQRLNLFNPQITVFGNFLMRTDDRPVFADDDPEEGRLDDSFHLREVEVDLRAPIDPWADGVLIATFESEVPGEFEALVEEGYVTLKKLPLLDRAPGGLKIKAGHFRAEFGRFNKIHLHDLPQVDYPRSLRTFLGPEGYVQEGLSAQFFLPSPGPSTALEATLQVLGGGDIPLAEDESSSNLAALAHLAWFQELTPSHSLEVGASAWSQESSRRLFGLDANYKWKPPAAGTYRSFLLGGELFVADLDEPGFDSNPLGFYVFSQVQLDLKTYVGARYDRAEDLADSDLATDTYSAYLTYYTTEFLRFRVGYEHARSDLALLDDRDSAFLEINFVFGSHPVEPYWVNR